METDRAGNLGENSPAKEGEKEGEERGKMCRFKSEENMRTMGGELEEKQIG